MSRNTKILDKLYFTIGLPTAFSDPNRLFQAAKRHKQFSGTLNTVRKYLQSLDSYTLYRKVIRKFSRRKIIAKKIHEVIQIDLLDVSSLSKLNNNIKYLLGGIDVLSRFVYVYPVKTKKAEEVVTKIKKLLKDANNRFNNKRKVVKLHSDLGKEFTAARVKTFLKRKHIILYHTFSDDMKAAIIERFWRTFQTILYRYLGANHTSRYINVLNKIVLTYNTRVHRILRIAPSKVTLKNEHKIFNLLYKNYFKSEIKFKFQIGDTVRITKKQRTFQRGYEPAWHIEVYTIVKRFATTPPTYQLKDNTNEIIQGQFYEPELQAVNIQPDHTFPVKVIKSKGQRVLVEWIGYKNNQPQWIPKSQLQSIKQR